MAPPNQDAILRQFREELVSEDLLHDGDSIGTEDHVLLRFLRARHFNLKQAKVMWKNCYEWRKTAEGVGIDELYRRIDPFDYPERDHVFQFWPLFFHKTDKRGRPLNIHHFGRINTTELYKGISPERFWQAFLCNADSLTREVLPAASSAAGKHVDGAFVIVDLKGFGTGQFWQMKNLAKSSFQVSQDYFPETMSQLAIINAPSSFTAIWAVMRPWLAKETVEKVSVLGSNYASALLKLADAENLPRSLGGTCTCSDCDEEDGLEKSSATKVGGVDGQLEMGKCAFSSAGPWMVGRKERREGWLRGERELGLRPGELEGFSSKQAEKSTGQDLDSETSSQATPTASAEKFAEKKDDVEESASARTGASTDESSSGPSTPPLDAAQRELGEVRISGEDDASNKLDLPSKEHPETNSVSGEALPSH